MPRSSEDAEPSKVMLAPGETARSGPAEAVREGKMQVEIFLSM